MAIPTLLYGCETWGIREEDKARMSPEMKFFRTAKYTWQDYITNEDNLSKINTNPVEKKTQNYRNKWVEYIWRMDRNGLPYLNMKYQPCGKQSQGQSLKRLLDC